MDQETCKAESDMSQQSEDDTPTYFETQLSTPTANVFLDTVAIDSAPKSPSPNPSLMDFATPVVSVSAFCQAVLSKLVPHEFWGTGNAQLHNRQLFMQAVDRFIRLRRFESMTLHDACQGMKVSHAEV